MTAAVILAAGAGRRLGGEAKALLRDRHGVGFLEAIWTLCRRAGVQAGCVVVGEPHRSATEAEAARLGIAAVLNPDPARGMSSSVAVGFSHALDELDDIAALLWPVDHAAVQLATLETLIAAARPNNVVVPTFGGRGGHPTCFGRALWPALARCDEATAGARSVLAGAEQTERIAVNDPGVRHDVDLPSDLERVRL